MPHHHLVIAAGGSGGHLFPAMRLADALGTILPEISICFAASGLSSSPFFDAKRFSYVECHSAPWRGWRSLVKLVGGNSIGVAQSWRLMRSFKTTAVVGFGSFHTLPVMAAARFCGIPVLQYEANALPGQVNRLFSNYATATAVQFPMAERYLKGKTRSVAFGGAFAAMADRATAQSQYGLNPNLPTIVISGGSQGASAVNEIAAQAVSSLMMELQVIHLTGSATSADHYAALYKNRSIHAVVLPFEREMGRAWAVADLFIGRAGASTIGELIHARVPALLIPYPHAKDDHQMHNARFFVEQVGGGRVFAEKSLSPSFLGETITQALVQEKSAKSWRSAIARYSEKMAETKLEDVVIEFLRNIAY